jgi:hypothetical protein
MSDLKLQQLREKPAAGVASDLRLLADMVEANPMLGALLRNALRELIVFPHYYSVDASAVEEAFASRATIIDEGERSHRSLGTFDIRQAVFPGGGVAVRVYHLTSEQVPA